MEFRRSLSEKTTPQEFYGWITELVHHAHKGQMYGEKPYTYHLNEVEGTFIRLLDLKKIMIVRDAMNLDHYSVSDMVVYLRAACLAHDLFEDTEYGAVYLRNKGVPLFFIDIITAVTKTKGMSQVQYLRVVKSNPLAVLVKTPDSLSNLQHSIQSSWTKGIRKYTNVLRYLNAEAKNVL